MRTLHRYIWKEYIQQFILWGSIITVLGIGKIFFDYNDIFIGYRVTGGLLVRLVLNQVPVLLMDVIPFAALLGTLLFLGRMMRERELDVIRISGVTLFRMVAPVLFGTFLLCVGTFFWNDLVVPAANQRFQNEVRRLQTRQDLPLLKEHVVIKAPNNRFIYLNQVDHKLGKVGGILIIEAGVDGRWARLISADFGLVKQNTWELHHGVIHQFNPDGSIASEVKYNQMDLRMANDFWGAVTEEKKANEMRIEELYQQIVLSQRSGLPSAVYLVFFHMKFADSLIAIVLVFLAVPLTVLIGRNSRWVGFLYCILTILVYYTLQVIGRSAGANALIPAWVAAWTPHVIFLAVGIIMMIAVEQRRKT